MARLLLVKHAVPDIQPNVPAKKWRLGEQGRKQSARLAEALRLYNPSAVVTSDEPKAVETGRIAAEALELSFSSAPGLHEHDRAGVPYLDHPDDFRAAVKKFFERPVERVFGNESADEAKRRFIRAVETVLESRPDETVVLVAHGTVNTLLVAAHNGLEPFALWKSWPLGTFAVLSRPDYGLIEGPRVST